MNRLVVRLRKMIFASVGLTLLVLTMLGCAKSPVNRPATPIEGGRTEVLFWHFWGGDDGEIVDEIVRRFNVSQDRFQVRAVAMPGNNLDLKLFLAIAGGDPPDLVNQDDPIVADWAKRGAILPLSDLADESELNSVRKFLLPGALRLGEYDGQLYALCNGLDIRAFYYNATLLKEHGLQPPQSLAELDRIAETIAPPGQDRYEQVGYLPDSRRLWAWGAVFGGSFYDLQTNEPTLNDPRIQDALTWMTSYRERYGANALQAFRQGDQSLPGSAFPLLPFRDDSPHGRYAIIMDGQWRTRDIAKAIEERRRNQLPIAEFGVCPLPPPTGGRSDAGWVNGNFFVCPKGCRNREGAWAFMKFWSGLDGHAAEAAETCASGGWIPVSNQVIEQPSFQQFLDKQPLFREFVRLARSENQFPTPVIPGAALFHREVRLLGSRSLSDDDAAPPPALLKEANKRLTRRFAEVDE